MTRSRGIAAERAERFLIDASQFRLGHLLTESPHPRSLTLSDVARHDAADGLAMLFDVDRDVVDAYDRWSRSGEPQRLCDLVTASLMARWAAVLHRLRRHRPAQHPVDVDLAGLLAATPRARSL